MSYRLYGYWRSSASWRVRIGLALKEVPYEYVAVNLRSGEQRGDDHNGRNPLQQVPVLSWRDGDAPRQLTQSMAILDYLESQRPEPALFPADPFLRARAVQLAEVVNAGIQPLQNLDLLIRVQALGADRMAWGHDRITAGLAALQDLAAPTAGSFLVGDAVSIADLCLIPQLYNARRFGVNLEPLGLLTAVEARCAALPAFIAAHPDQQPDAF